jgi:NodT family efflux transporter outer membrane factor (OMF) lipoprotein
MANSPAARTLEPALRRIAGLAGAGGLGVLGVLLCAGCSVGPRYREPAVSDAAQAPFVSTSAAPVSSGPAAVRWWSLYRDPTLDKLVEEALAQNKDLAVAAARLMRARAVLDEADAARLPDTQLELGGNYGKQQPDQIVAAAKGTSAPTRWAYAPSFSVSWEVDLWGRVRHLTESARADAEAEQAAADALRVAVAAQTTHAYVNVCSYGDQLDVAQRSLSIAQRIVALTQKQRALGLVSELEVTRAQAFADDTRATLPALEGQRRAALYELAVLMGRTPGAFPAEVAQCKTTPALAAPFPVGDGAALLKRRPDLREAERRLAAAVARVGVATADLYPSVTLGGSVNLLSTTGSLSSLGDKYAAAWGVGPLITWRFPNLAVNRAQLLQAKADDAQALASFDQRVLTALKETEQALTVYGSEWERRRALQEARAQHARAFQLAELNYQAGALDFLDVLDAERSLAAVDATLAASTGQVAADQIAVFKALGGGWQQ